jgi:hypothetical protein
MRESSPKIEFSLSGKAIKFKNIARNFFSFGFNFSNNLSITLIRLSFEKIKFQVSNVCRRI